MASITLTFNLDSNLDEGIFVLDAVKRAYADLRDAAQNASAPVSADTTDAPSKAPVAEAVAPDATPEPVREEGQEEHTAPAASAPTVAPFAGALPAGLQPVSNLVPLPPATVVDEAVAALKRGRGRPKLSEEEKARRAALVASQTATAPATPQVLVTEEDPSTRAAPGAVAPVNLFDNPAAPVKTSEATGAPAPAAAGLSVAQRQAAFAAIYSMRPEGPHRAIALVQRFGVKRVTDLLPEQHAEFDTYAARTLNGTFDPIAGADVVTR
jgi:hypothetical protein